MISSALYRFDGLVQNASLYLFITSDLDQEFRAGSDLLRRLWGYIRRKRDIGGYVTLPHCFYGERVRSKALSQYKLVIPKYFDDGHPSA